MFLEIESILMIFAFGFKLALTIIILLLTYCSHFYRWKHFPNERGPLPEAGRLRLRREDTGQHHRARGTAGLRRHTGYVAYISKLGSTRNISGVL